MSANGLHRIRWRRVVVARVHRTAACQFARYLVNIQHIIVKEGGVICRKTDSIGSDGDGLPSQESIFIPFFPPPSEKKKDPFKSIGLPYRNAGL